jgi:hypothetical protein
MRNAEHIYSIADQHAQTVQVCVDRLQELGADEQLKRLSGRLQKLAVRATPGDEDGLGRGRREEKAAFRSPNEDEDN